MALWSDAKSIVDGGRVWGGFISARSELDNGCDSQLVGLEVDVLNSGLPGEYPNESKVGIQIVGFGNLATHAIEILSDEQGLWQNGINVSEHTIWEKGTIIGVTQSTPIRIGIDFSNTPFTDAALAIANDSKITMRSKSGNPAAIYTDNFDDGYLVLQSGVSGVRITDNTNSKNLLTIHADGTIEACALLLTDGDTFKNDFNNIQLIVVCIMFIGIILLIVYCVFLHKKLQTLSGLLTSNCQLPNEGL